jgi:hypothetical protein
MQKIVIGILLSFLLVACKNNSESNSSENSRTSIDGSWKEEGETCSGQYTTAINPNSLLSINGDSGKFQERCRFNLKLRYD